MGHAEGELWGLATHPSRDIYASASYDGDIKIWSVKSKKLIKKHATDLEVRCIDFSPEGSNLAIGTKEGDISLFRVSKEFDLVEKIDSNRQRKACITDIKFVFSIKMFLNLIFHLLDFMLLRFSPRKGFLASGSNDNAIDIYQINEGKLTRIAYCIQVPGPVLQMDWSTSAEYLKVNLTIYTKNLNDMLI